MHGEKSLELLFLRTVPSCCILDYFFSSRRMVWVVTRDEIRLLKIGEKDILFDSGIISYIVTVSFTGVTT